MPIKKEVQPMMTATFRVKEYSPDKNPETDEPDLVIERSVGIPLTPREASDLHHKRASIEIDNNNGVARIRDLYGNVQAEKPLMRRSKTEG
jgi:hypothetical protein